MNRVPLFILCALLTACATTNWRHPSIDDPAANAAGGPRISTANSRVPVWVIPTNEELMIARHTRTLVAADASG